jgi:phytoene dehydrogenase-like protein
MARPYRDRIMQFLEDNYLPDLQANIVAEHYIDPLHFQDTLNSYRGAAFSVRPSLLQAAWLRPHNRSEEFENLYFVGAGTHPGAGVPAVMSSGKIAAELIDPSPAAGRAGGEPWAECSIWVSANGRARSGRSAQLPVARAGPRLAARHP